MLSPPEFDAVHLVDTEYQTGTGDRCKPICMVSCELYSGRVDRRWLWNCDPGTPPWNPRDPRTLVVSFSAPAECGVFAALGWAQPCRILDLWAEYRVRTNGLTRATGLLSVLKVYGIPAPIETDEKKAWQKLCAEGSSSAIESRRDGIVGYCERDVGPMVALYLAMLSGTNWREALFRGEYGVACAEIEDRGIPVDADRIAILVDRWVDVRRAAAVIASMRMRFGIYGGPWGTAFSYKKLEEYLRRVGLLDSWPRTASGRLQLDDDTLKLWAARHEDLDALRQARRTMSMIHPSRICVGADGRCRTPVRPFAATTGRNQPKAQTPLAFPSWMRASIVGPLVVLDFAQQEFALAAILSGDQAMLRAYASGDAYLALAIQCGALPVGSVRGAAAVEATRDLYKVASVAILYGVSVLGLAMILGVTEHTAYAIMLAHRRTYPRFWQWTEEVGTTGEFGGVMTTSRGWRVDTSKMGERSIKNWPVQSCAGDILRLATVVARRRGIRIVALVHDSLIIEPAPGQSLREAADVTKNIMIAAGEAVAGVTLRVDQTLLEPGGRRCWPTS